MKLISVNVSLPKEIEFNNEVVKTGIFKKPITGSIAVTHLNLAGDQQVDLKNHGGEHKAVYGFSSNHYEYWRETLDNPELCFGQFGENLTISDLDESQLCIGDRLQIADCILEVTQPRVPCFKLGIAMNLRTMPKLFIQRAATGIYFRVIQSGSICTGESVNRIFKHPAKLSVQQLFKAYFDKEFANSTSVMQLAATIPELSDEWQQKVHARL
jgi:MOSC domain-containing protein YiiM